ncbi:hypothetical protein [Namhaeicola litoreus]|uniref:AsmA family protein n=1 Tax=Namhaeicola litoreus TaxID=1052145 RepID=A0ABW3Y1J7_9FLAO
MAYSLKKIAVNLGKVLLGLLILVFVIIAFALNFVFTPEKITPKIVSAINKNLEAEMRAESIELSFFKTFPSFTLEIDDGAIVNHLNDSIKSAVTVRRDTVVSFERCQVTVNPWAFLRNKIVINHLIFEKPQIYAFISESGEVNWDILKTTDSIESQPDSPVTETEFDAKIDIKDVRIRDGYLFFENGLTNLFSSLEELELRLKAKYDPKKILLDIDCQSNSSNLFKKGDTLLHDFGLGIVSKLEMDRVTKALHTEKTKLILNDAAFVLNGDIALNQEKKILDLDLNFGLENASIENLMGLLPPSVINKKSIPSSKGEVNLDGNIKGAYGKNSLPTVNAALNIKNGELAYKEMPNKIDELEAEMTLFIDPTKEEISFVKIENCKIIGNNTAIKIDANVSDLLDNTRFNANLDGKVDFGELQKTIPFKEGIKLAGIFSSKVELSFTKDDIERSNYGDIKGKGFFMFENFFIENTQRQNVFSTKYSKMEFIQSDESTILSDAGTKVRGGRIDISDLILQQNEKLQFTVAKLFAEYGAIPKKDTTSIRRIKSKFELKQSKFNIGDTLKGEIRYSKGVFFVNPSELNPVKPSVKMVIEIDSVGIKSKNNYFAIKKGRYNVSTEKNEKNLWPLNGEISFGSLILYTPSFPLELKMPETSLKLSEGIINLEKAHMQLGRSDFTASGKLANFGGRFFRDELLKGELNINSKFTDVNQLIKTLNEGEKNEKAEDKDPDSKMVTIADVETADSTSVFVVPKGVEFIWNTQLEEVKMGKLILKNLNGLVTLKDQKIEMNSLSMITNGAKMYTSSTYEAKSKQLANLNMDFKLLDIDLANLIDMFPVLDSIMPMAGSFDGNVNFRMKGRANMDANLGMSANKLELIARILGKNMVIMDSETFQEIAKKLFFKNKEKNIIDEMSFALQYKDQVLEVFPSEFQVDRYRLALGGVQKLNGSYSFHISVLKTPIPLLKMGIDVIGTDQGNNMDLTKARYKYFFAKSDRKREKADQELMARKEAVIKRLPF